MLYGHWLEGIYAASEIERMRCQLRAVGASETQIEEWLESSVREWTVTPALAVAVARRRFNVLYREIAEGR